MGHGHSKRVANFSDISNDSEASSSRKKSSKNKNKVSAYIVGSMAQQEIEVRKRYKENFERNFAIFKEIWEKGDNPKRYNPFRDMRNDEYSDYLREYNLRKNNGGRRIDISYINS